MKQIVFNFIKKETVLVIATILAILSAFWVKPDANYFSYIDWRVLGILLSLMLIMAGLQKHGLFDKIGKWLLSKTKNTVQLAAVLVFLCFFFSMLITNDVALLTFVPFAMLTLQACQQEKLLMPVIVLQTIAANLGSMLTPIGNPQNLYLYQLLEVGIGGFLKIMLPYTIVAGVLLAAAILWIGREREKITVTIENNDEKKKDENAFFGMEKWKTVCYLVLFFISLLVVARWIPWYLVLILILVAVAVMDRDVLGKVDYCLLLTFISFFVFTGNIGRVNEVREGLQHLVAGRELGVGILASQVISNVPAALLLSGFTSDVKALLLGVNLGGLGTLIASMASLISYKIYAVHYNEKKGRYFIWFTLANLAFLVVLVGVATILS